MKEVYTLKAVNIGGASGVVVPPEELDCPMEYGVCAARGITIGSGAVYVMDERRSILDNVQNRVNFFLHESCGKCTPCREGLRQAIRIIERVLAGQATFQTSNVTQNACRRLPSVVWARQRATACFPR